ncbi:ABC transporter substrate-binding protein [Rhodococcus sp. NPDC019627]|uniref:ABC transporter substrate-binding protein n=1 Tax=Rhodococcus TaxID=1827 RepID=UPI00135C0F49|nr:MULTISPECIES: ABC transporter substrate-binding protein [Rhodococcus]MDV7353413.1 ABC transporter substrate-binding protein [Rhodococcus oxybenzonivorans]
MPPTLSRRAVLSLTFATVAGLAVSACGSDSDSSPAAAGENASGAEPGAFPVTIDHVHGSTTLTQAPTRVAAVGIGDADVLLSLGVIPVLVPVWKGSVDDGIGQWADASLGGADPIALANATSSFDVETIAASTPDLIVAVNNAINESTYQQLSAIAPTVLHAADQTDWVLPWQEVTQRIGAAVGLPERAAEQVREVEEAVVRARTANPHFAGKSAVLVTVRGDGSLRAFSPSAARSQLLTQLGFVLPAALSTRFDNALYFDVSPENLDLLDGDVLLVDNYDAARERLTSLPAFTNLEVVRSGGLVGLDPVVSDAVSMPNPLTIPFVLDQFVDRINRTPVGA